MKRSITTLMLLLFAVVAFGQVQPGFYVEAAARTNNVVSTPTVGWVQGSLGYRGRYAGISVTALTDSKFQTSKVEAVGLSAHVNVVRISNMDFSIGAEALKLIHERRAWRDLAFTPDASVTVPLAHTGFIASASILGFYHREVTKKSDIWRICEPGAKLTIGYQLWGHKKKYLVQ